ncbi:CDP-glucose 4,6-dehydratase [Pseudodesulfovibrio methanolicus]|uniref:CDP-glucose 4,6-dehydratase n=1 Tax=Pseudodesulfovibrio methanolicus TaxID=3126690 RepID=A0ABZ2ISA3_9BACT
MLREFYKGKRVFLTGDTGFKGAWLSLWLTRLGAEVGTYSLAPHTTPSLHELAGVASRVQRLGGDIRQPAPLAKAMRDFRPDIVVHMAAQSLVRPSYEDPLTTFETNVMGTANLLDAVRGTDSVRAVINVTSDKCYENREWIWGYRENDPMGGHDPYSASKGCAELVAASYIKSYFSSGRAAVASVRAGNVIGGGDFAKDRLIPDMVRAFSRGEAVKIRSPRATRPWQHVLEPCTDTSCSPKGSQRTATPSRAAGTSARPTSPPALWAKWLRDSARNGVTEPGTSWMKGTTRTRRACSSSTAPRPPEYWSGAQKWISSRHWTGPPPGTRRGPRVPTARR